VGRGTAGETLENSVDAGEKAKVTYGRRGIIRTPGKNMGIINNDVFIKTIFSGCGSF
jgi:hypothetical protein